MKLGAQFFTLRERCKTDEDIREAFKRVKEIGYSVAQMSAIWPKDANLLKSLSEEFDLPITCTHAPLDRILNDTDALILDHKIYGCETVGLGMMPMEYLSSMEGAREFIKKLREPIKRIRDAGLRFAYHNHHFEFVDFGGRCIYDMLIEEAPDMDFIPDIYWFKYAGADFFRYVKLLGKERIQNVHFKDMLTDPQGPICPCGKGVIDFKPYAELCDSLGIPYGLVEQDNAPSLGDEFLQMKESYDNLKSIFDQ